MNVNICISFRVEFRERKALIKERKRERELEGWYVKSGREENQTAAPVTKRNPYVQTP